jgi:hypothetical protein
VTGVTGAIVADAIATAVAVGIEIVVVVVADAIAIVEARPPRFHPSKLAPMNRAAKKARLHQPEVSKSFPVKR